MLLRLPFSTVARIPRVAKISQLDDTIPPRPLADSTRNLQLQSFMKTLLNSIKWPCAAILALALPAVAQTTDTWTGGGADANWQTAANWQALTAPSPGDSLVFSGSAASPNNNFTPDTAFGGLSFATGASQFDLTGNEIDFSGTIANLSPSTQAIDLSLVLTGSSIINATGGEIDFGVNAGGISGANALTINGPGLVHLTNVTYSGGTTLGSSGNVQVDNVNGNYTLGGGTLLLTYGSWYSTPTISFTADSSLGVNSGAPNYNSYGRYDCYGNVGSPGFKWTVFGTGRFQMAGGGNIFAGSVDVTSPAVLSGLGNGANATLSPLGTNTITVEDGAALRVNNAGIVLAPIVLEGGDGPDSLGALVANEEAYAGQPTTITATFSNSVTIIGGDTTLGAQYGSMVIDGNIAGAGSLTKIGAYPLVLGASNNYAGSTTIGVSGTLNSGGTVQLAAANALPVGTAVAINANSVLDFDGNVATVSTLNDDGAAVAVLDNTSANPATLTVTGGASWSGTIQNSGGGPLSLVGVGCGLYLSGIAQYTGATMVEGGSLDMNMPSTTTTGGLFLATNNATINLHYLTPTASLPAAGATLGGSSSDNTALNIDLNSYGNVSKPVINATNGTGVLTALGTIQVTINNPANLVVGAITLIKYNSLVTGSGTSFQLTPMQGIGAVIVTNAANKSIDLDITSSPITTWTASTSTNWDYTTKNWVYAGKATNYVDNESVFFDDTASKFLVNLTASLSPASVLITATNTYLFTGPGQVGNGALTKKGTGTLIIDTANNSISSTTISAGTVQLGNNDNVGDLGSANIIDQGTLAFMEASAFTVGNIISGNGSVAQNDTNTTKLTGANTYAGGTLVNSGTLQMGVKNALGTPGTGVAGVTVAAGASFDLNGYQQNTTNAMIINGLGNGPGANVSFGALGTSASGGGMNLGYGHIGAQNVVLQSDAAVGGNYTMEIGTGNGTGIGITGNGHVLWKEGTATLYVDGSAINSPSMVIIDQGNIILNQSGNSPFGSATIVLTNNTYFDTWDNSNHGYTLGNNFVIANNGGQILNDQGTYYAHTDWNTYTGNVLLNGICTIGCTGYYTGGGQPSGNTFTLGTSTFTGAFTGVGGVVIVATNTYGGNTITLSGANNYSGPTTILTAPSGAGGTLALSQISQGGGAYTNQDGGTLDVPSQKGFTTVPMSTLALGSLNGANLSLLRVASFATAPITATNLVLTGANTLALPPALFAGAPGEYPLIKYSALSGSGTLSVGGGVRGVPGYVTNDTANSEFAFVINGGSPVVWTGSSSANWDINSTANWIYNGSSTTYQQSGALGDAVTFNDSSSVTNVNISASVSPTLLIVNNTNDYYTFSGSTITGGTALLKEGPGTLILTNGANTFTGGATVLGGTVKLGSSGSLNNSSGSVTVSGNGAVDFNNQQPTALACTISGAGFNGLGTLVQNSGLNNDYGPASVTMTGSATVGGNNRWDIRNGANTFNTPTNAYTLTKVGTGFNPVFVGTKVSTNLGDIYVMAGMIGYETGTTGLGNPTNTLYLGTNATLEMWSASVPLFKNIVMNNGAALQPDSGGGSGGPTTTVNIISGPIYLAGGNANINCNYYNGCAISNTISGPGGLTTGYNGYTRMYAPNTYVGDTSVLGGIYLYANSSIVSTNNLYINVGPLFLTNNATAGTSTTYINDNAGALILGASATIQFATLRVGGATLDVTGRTDQTLTLAPGEFVRIDNGATIKGNIVAGSGSTVAPGGNGYIQNTGTQTGNLTFQGGSTCSMDVSVTTTTNYDVINVVGNLTYGGTLAISQNGATGFQAGQSFKLFNATTYAGSFASITPATPGAGLLWNASQLATNGTLSVVASPLPATGTNITFGVLGNQLTMSWPTNYTGWLLQSNSVNLANTNDWFTVPGSASTNTEVITVNPAQPAVFYRMMHP